jgi:hypothetical protein
MAQIVDQFPNVSLYCHELDEYFAVILNNAEKKFQSIVTLPPNPGDEDLTYRFEARIDETLTGHVTVITVLCETVYANYRLEDVRAEPNKLSPAGGETIIYVDFTIDDEHIPIVTPPTNPIVVSSGNELTIEWGPGTII